MPPLAVTSAHSLCVKILRTVIFKFMQSGNVFRHRMQAVADALFAGQVHGTMSYTAQEPWIQNCSLQDNILMQLPLDGEQYHQVLQACALLPDLELLPAGDQTEIGAALQLLVSTNIGVFVVWDPHAKLYIAPILVSQEAPLTCQFTACAC